MQGEVILSGAKNAASKMMIAALLTEDAVRLHNVPRQQETALTEEILRLLGAEVSWSAEELTVKAKTLVSAKALEGLPGKNRIAILTLAPMLHRFGEAFVPQAGGDKIGGRPINWHVMALEAMGASIESVEGGYRATTPRGLSGALIDLPYPSVGATETALLAGVLAKGRTVIKNAAIEPEIFELIKMLQKMGAVVEVGAGRQMEIFGVPKLSGCDMEVMPDPLEAASYACLALGTRGDVFVRGATHDHMLTFLNAVRRIGGSYEVQKDGIRFWTTNDLQGIELETDTHPGFRTDWQAPFVVVLTQARGTSVVHETVYESRFGYVEALKRMGADISLFSNCLGEIPCRFKGQNYLHSAVIKGPTALHAADVVIPDIRAGLAFLLAALVAEGKSVLSGVEHLDRGYERLEEKLKGLGIVLTRKEL